MPTTSLYSDLFEVVVNNDYLIVSTDPGYNSGSCFPLAWDDSALADITIEVDDVGIINLPFICTGDISQEITFTLISSTLTDDSTV